MARPGFLNDNEARAYPLVPVVPDLYRGGVLATRLPHSLLVDFGCVVGLTAGFDDREHAVQLHSVARTDVDIQIEFRCTAPGLSGHALRFVRTFADPEFACEEAEAVAIGLPGADDPCPARDDPLWEGFLVTGLLTDLAAVMFPGEILLAGAVPPTIEPDPRRGAAGLPGRLQRVARRSGRLRSSVPDDRQRRVPPGAAGAPRGLQLRHPAEPAR
jgi:hypothetical protein